MCKKMNNNKPQTRVIGTPEVITNSESLVLELRHQLCNCRKVCQDNELLSSEIRLEACTTEKICNTDIYKTKVNVVGELKYTPAQCGGCPVEDVVYTSFFLYTTKSTVELTSNASAVEPYFVNNCDKYTSLVDIMLPFSVKTSS